jgi:hypothetical protein
MWEEFASISSVVANIATALAVAFAGYQLWLLNRHARIESHLNLVQSEREIWLAALATPDISNTVVDEVWGISARRHAKTNLFWAIFMDSCEHMFVRHQAGIMSARDWNSMESYIGRLIKAPSFQACWNDIRADYAPEFVAYLGSRMAEPPDRQVDTGSSPA